MTGNNKHLQRSGINYDRKNSSELTLTVGDSKAYPLG